MRQFDTLFQLFLLSTSNVSVLALSFPPLHFFSFISEVLYPLSFLKGITFFLGGGRGSFPSLILCLVNLSIDLYLSFYLHLHLFLPVRLPIFNFLSSSWHRSRVLKPGLSWLCSFRHRRSKVLNTSLKQKKMTPTL